VVVVAAGGQEKGIGHPDHHVKAEDADIERMDSLDVGRLQMDVADSGAGSDGSRSALARDHSSFVLGLAWGFGAHGFLVLTLRRRPD
jgi:hypothetical protein